MDLAFVALRLRVWNLLFNLFILRHADYRYVDISLPIVLFCFFLFKFTQSRNPVDAATIRRRGERFLTSKSGRGHGVFHSKGDRPRGGTGGLRIRLCHHDLHDRKHPGAPAAGALLAGLGFSLLPCPLWALAVLAVPLTLHPNKQYLLENKKALILRSRLSVLASFAVAAALAALQWVPVSIVTAGYLLSALSRLYAKAHYRPAS